MPGQADLFLHTPAAAVLPAGLRYAADFLTQQEEHHYLTYAQSLPLAEMNYKGYLAKRRVLSFGGKYDYVANRLNEGPPIPAELDALREKAGAWAGIDPAAFTQILVAEYRPGTPLGWHRDVPDFEDVVGVSLLAPAVMRFRPYPPDAPKKSDVIKLTIEPRSIYLLRGAARWDWQHSVAAVNELRYSITLRTPRKRR